MVHQQNPRSRSFVFKNPHCFPRTFRSHNNNRNGLHNWLYYLISKVISRGHLSGRWITELCYFASDCNDFKRTNLEHPKASNRSMCACMVQCEPHLHTKRHWTVQPMEKFNKFLKNRYRLGRLKFISQINRQFIYKSHSLKSTYQNRYLTPSALSSKYNFFFLKNKQPIQTKIIITCACKECLMRIPVSRVICLEKKT